SRAILIHCTRASGLRIGAAMDHLVSAPSPVQIASSSYTDSAEVTATVMLQPGERFELIKFVSYGWSSTRSLPAVRDQVRAALTTAVQTGFRAAGRAARLPGRLLGPGRRADRRGHRDPAGGQVRAVPRAAGRGPGGEPGHPGEGADRSW